MKLKKIVKNLRLKKMTEGFDNENFVNDEMDNTITILLLGLQRAGKTSIKRVTTLKIWERFVKTKFFSVYLTKYRAISFPTFHQRLKSSVKLLSVLNKLKSSTFQVH